VGGWILALAGCGFTADAKPDTDPELTVGFLATTSLQDELSGSITVTVALDRPTTDLVSVQYRFSGGSATNGLDYTGSDNLLSIPPGATEAKIPLTINQDANEEDSETIEITLSDPVGATLGTSKHTITISSNILPRVGFTTSTSSADEGLTEQLTVALDAASTVPITVDYVVNGSATAVKDYALVMGTVSFAAGETQKVLDVGIVDDALDEFDEDVLITLTSSTNVVVAMSGTSHDHTIVDNDPEPTVGFMVGAQSKGENTATVDIIVKLSAPSGKPIMVDVVPGNAPAIAAAAGVDYSYPATTTLTFAPETTQQTFTVTLIDDALDELDEGFTTALAVQVAYNVSLGGIAENVVTITDNDAPPQVHFMTASRTVLEGNTGTTPYTYTVQLDVPSGLPITVPITISGNALNPGDYTVSGSPISIAAGATTGSITIDVVGDTVKETASNGTKDVIMTIPTAGLVNVTRAGSNTSKTLTIQDDD